MKNYEMHFLGCICNSNVKKLPSLPFQSICIIIMVPVMVMATKFICILLMTCHAFLPPANEVCEGYFFTGVCLSTGGGGMHGGRGACMVVGGMHGGGHTWWQGACMVAGGIHGGGGMHGGRGACMVVGSMCGGRGWGHTWWWGACMVVAGACMVYDEIRSMSGWYASYWNAFLSYIYSIYNKSF